jgi:hypothetical protein
MNENTHNLLGQAIEVIEEEGGRVLISKNDDGTWVVGMEWGKEAEDSPMAGAAAYGLDDSLDAALERCLGDAGLTEPKSEKV